MTRQPHIPPADWSPRSSRDLLQEENNPTNGVVARLLELRGITEEQAPSFFHPDLEELHDPSEMRDMDRTVDRIIQAQREGECIMAYGDYDVDGATSVSLIHDFLHNNGFDVLPYIPDRYSEGYGLSSKGVQWAAEKGCSIIITLDCGIRATERVAEANALGIDVIICDHHLPGESMPEAFAILNPKHPDCHYPFKELSGCGVAFKLTQALTERIGLSPLSAYDGLDLVALSIASDLVEVTGEHLGGAADGCVHGEAAAIAAQVEHGAALGERPHQHAVIALVREEAGLVAGACLDRVAQFVFVHRGGDRVRVRQLLHALAERPVLVLEQDELPLGVVPQQPLSERLELLAPAGRCHLRGGRVA